MGLVLEENALSVRHNFKVCLYSPSACPSDRQYSISFSKTHNSPPLDRSSHTLNSKYPKISCRSPISYQFQCFPSISISILDSFIPLWSASPLPSLLSSTRLKPLLLQAHKLLWAVILKKKYKVTPLGHNLYQPLIWTPVSHKKNISPFKCMYLKATE